jgi:hypothetical protein
MDPATIAAATVTVLSPYLTEIGHGALDKIGEDAIDAGGKLINWLRNKLSGNGQEALKDLATHPNDSDTQATLRVQIKKTLEANPTLANELSHLLQQTGAIDASTMTVTAGDGAKVAQIKGSNKATNIS